MTAQIVSQPGGRGTGLTFSLSIQSEPWPTEHWPPHLQWVFLPKPHLDRESLTNFHERREDSGLNNTSQVCLEACLLGDPRSWGDDNQQ